MDARSDIFSLGVVLYEMLTGRRPFQGDSHISTRLAILRDLPPPPRELIREVPAELERVVLRCLEKPKEKRYAAGADVLGVLRRISSRPVRPHRRYLVYAGAFLFALAAAGAWWWVQSSRSRWAGDAVSEISRLTEEDHHIAAFHLAREAKRLLPDDPEVQRAWESVVWPTKIETEPPGAEIYWKEYADPDGDWVFAGTSPLNADLPVYAYLRYRVVKDGFEPSELASYAVLLRPVVLTPSGSGPEGMVRVPGGAYALDGEASVEFPEYWLDRYEVTNREYMKFVAAGGYEDRRYWTHPFFRSGRELTWEEGVSLFVDKTGRPGPSTWELGSFPEAEEDFPLRGVSWYEAAAFAEFSGKALPTVYHWRNATDAHGSPSVVQLSNFSGQGPARAGLQQGIGPHGTFDMAGNVKEWVFNRSGDRRYVLGGSWNEPVYMYQADHAQSPFERADDYGFRSARYTEPLSEALTGPIESLWRDYAKETPVGDEVFEAYRNMYSYDRFELNALAESMESGSRYWTKERVEFDAAYGGERVVAYLYLPVNAAPPYQTVVYFPHSGASWLDSHEYAMQYADFVIRGGRALLYPIYKGTFERRDVSEADGPSSVRDRDVQRFKDLARSLDYLESRPDIDQGKFAYFGFSWGAHRGVIFAALESRLRTSVLLAGGLDQDEPRPEVDAFHFAPRVKIPVLMINGRDDFRFPLEESQKPLFNLLGTPPQDKRHALIEGGHVPPLVEVIKETLSWLDRYLGPVAPKRPE